MGFVYLAEKMGMIITKNMIIGIVLVGGIFLVTLGIIIKKLGLYDMEMYIDAHRNPVQDEILRAARKINKRVK
jgi:hypothetical protein